MKRFTKNIFKELKYSFGRFVAILAIVALGIGFLIGVLQATPDMKHSMDTYYRDSMAYDCDVKGTFGLRQQDIEAISNLKDAQGDPVVETVTPIVSTDAMVRADGQTVVGRIIGLDFSALTRGEALNQLTLEEGRFPQAPGEVVVERANANFLSLALGDTIDIEDYGSYGDVYALESFRVVGIVSSPDYYYLEGREITSIGTGVVGTVIYAQAYDSSEDAQNGVYDLSAPDNIFGLQDATIFSLYNFFAEEDLLYTDCYVTFSGSEEYELFSDSYEDFVSESCDKLSDLGDTQSDSVNQTLRDIESNPLLGGAVTLGEAEWMILDRCSTNVSYVSFAMNVEKVEAIAGVFPIFFIVVAALVALTSMTRMVEEDRMQIGTFKALGYRNGKITSKYLFYCCLATLIGCGLGLLFGFALLPNIFWEAYRTMYFLPNLSLAIEPLLIAATFLVSLVLTALVTLFTCRPVIKTKPSVLMQPKAPKPGKRILLERIPLLWNPLPFKWKATFRNIFRYKKNIVLTIISVMGCTALILTGFGLNDSIRDISELQYGKVFLYDSIVKYNASALEEETDSELKDFLSQSEVSHLSLYTESGQLLLPTSDGTARESVDLYVIEDSEAFRSFVDLHERESQVSIDVNQQGIILPENIAVVYQLQAGDRIQYVSAAKHVHSLTVLAVCESYTGSYAYLNADQFSDLEPNTKLEHNTLLIHSGIQEEDIESTTEQLLHDSSVSSVEFIQDTIRTFDGLSSTMGLIVAVLVVCAGALAAIVLYNLTNINIDERRREVATLRVLGYRKSEVAGYIYRESAILTIAGTLLGLLLGFFLHRFVITRVDSVAMMFGRVISGWSYLWAFLLTIAFAVIVYAFMLIKLNKINMAESLKSNE